MTASVEPMSQPREEYSPWAPVVWAILSLLLFAASSMGIFVVNWIARVFIDVPHLVEMAEWSLVWGGCSMLGVLIAGRIAFARRVRVEALGLVLGGIGIALSAVVHVVLQQWAVVHIGEWDAEWVGSTAFLFAVLIGLATAAFGVFVAPPGAAAWPLGFVLIGAAGTIIIVLANVPGLGDGIEPESWPLAIWIGLSGLYAALVTVACVIRARHPAATPER